MVEADEDVGDEEAALGQAGALRRKLDGRLQPRGVVVGEVADDRLAAGLGLGEVAEMRAGADERVSAETAALDRFEQERSAALAAQAQVRAEWGDEVGCDVGCDGHDESSEDVRGRKKTFRWKVSNERKRVVSGLASAGAGSRPARSAKPRRCEWRKSSSSQSTYVFMPVKDDASNATSGRRPDHIACTYASCRRLVGTVKLWPGR